jgi:phage terminase large subunit-like protein
LASPNVLPATTAGRLRACCGRAVQKDDREGVLAALADESM